MDDEEEYGDIADDDLIQAFSQASHILPDLPSSRENSRRSHERGRWTSLSTTGNDSGNDEIQEEEEEGPRAKKIRSRMIYNGKEVPAAKIVTATQGEQLEALFSSPTRIRGPIYKRPRPELLPPSMPAICKQKQSIAQAFQRTATSSQTIDVGFEDEFENIPPEFLIDDENDEFAVPGLSAFPAETQTQDSRSRQRLVAVQQGLKQTTLFGSRAAETVTASQAKKVHNFIVDRPAEAATHHKLDKDNLKTWVYPLNLGKIRDYQYSIVRHALFHNTLVALPTGLGKTCIAATIMLNFFRWTTDSQIVFVAPTKPLVSQQVDACFNIVGIPKSQTTLLTGEQPPALRAEEWESKRVFFMTPQTLDNDLRTGIADPKKIVLLVVDEAHRAKGNYAYVKVVELLRRFNKSFRILALTATPGADVEAVQEVIDNLEISKVEIRTEDSIDIQQYVHTRDIEQILLDPSDEINMCKELLSKALQPLVNQLCGQNAYYNRDPMSLTAFGMMQASKNWRNSPAGRAASQPIKGMMQALFTVLASIAHSIKLLSFHGIKPFYDKIKDFRTDSEASRNGGGKYRKQILDHPDFRTMTDRLQMWTSNPDFVGHPKLEHLCQTVLNHFLDAEAGRLGEDAPPSATRVIVFSEYRDSAETITKALNRHGPILRASVFVGQADSKRSEGMKQAQQIETVENFKKGRVNVLVATSIGEEGLDIGQVDLIVCYDASSSPIRMLQRMGRTGRKRAGRIVLLLMRGKEQTNFSKAKDNYSKMQKLISNGDSFAMRYDLSVRIIPREIVPEVDKRIINIPIENTQDPGLPEPKKRQPNKKRKRPEKKFHMPDGVQTGFQKASALTSGSKSLDDMGIISTKKRNTTSQTDNALTPILDVESVFLKPTEESLLERRYIEIDGAEGVEVGMPDFTLFPIEQRYLGHTISVSHGEYTKRCVKLFNKMGQQDSKDLEQISQLSSRDLDILVENLRPPSDDEVEIVQMAEKKRASPKSKLAVHGLSAIHGIANDDKVEIVQIAKRKKRAPAKLKIPVRRPIAAQEVDGEEESSRPPMKKPVKKRSVKSQQQRLRDSEGEGHDLDESEARSDDSEEEGSLKDFIASTNAATSSAARLSSSPLARRKSPSITYTTEQRRVSMQVDSSGEEDAAEDAIRRHSGLGRAVINLDSASGHESADEQEEDDDDVTQMQGRRGRGRKVFEESDDSDE